MSAKGQKKTAVITGGNSGIGFAIAQEMAKRGARVCLACRNAGRARVARQEILAAHPGADVEIYTLDLASFAAIHRFAEELLENHSVLDVLVNNAGAYPSTQRFTKDGFDLMFGGNTLGPILLTHLLLPSLEKSSDGRIVHMSSMMHHIGDIDFDSFRGDKKYCAMTAYAQSKLGNLLFSNALARRTGVVTVAMHPGGVASPFYREWPQFVYAGMKLFLISPDAAAKLAADLALAPKYRRCSGEYFSAQFPYYSSSRSKKRDLQERFYKHCCRLVGIKPLPLCDG